MAYQKKNKFVATTLTAAMVAVVVAPTAGAAAVFPDVEVGSWYEAEVKALADANIMNGNGTGNFNINAELSRAEAAKVLAELRGLNLNAPAATKYVDVKQNEWYAKYVNAIVAAGLSTGTSATTFSPDQKLSRGELAKLAVDAYGLTLTPNAATPFTDIEGAWYTPYIKTLYSAGLINGTSATTFSPMTKIDRRSFAKLVVNVEYAKGNKPVKPAATVTSVSAINSTSVTVKFNKEVDATTATTAANYSIDGVALNGAPYSLTASNFEISADKKSVTITLPLANDLTTGSTYRIAVSDSVKDVAGNKFAAFETLYKFVDTAAPTVTTTKYNAAESKFYINFSEPLTAASAGLVKVLDSNNTDVTAGAGRAILTTDGKTIVVDAAVAPAYTANGTYRVVMLGAQDLSANYFENNRVEASFKVAKAETVAPTVTDLVSKGLQTVRVTFSEPLFVDGAAADKIATIALDGAASFPVVKAATLGAAGTAVDVNGDGKTWDIQVAVANLDGVKKVTVDAAIDLQGNTIASAYAKFVTFTADTTAPALVSSTTAGTKLYLTFDEATVLTAGNVTVLTPDNVLKTVAVTTGAGGTLTNDGTNTKVVVVELGTAVVSKNGSYKVTLASGLVKDAGNVTKAYESTNVYNVNADASKPTLKMNAGGTAVDATAVVQTGSTPSEITFTFSEKMNSTALNVDNYTLNGVKAFSSAVFVGDTDTVRFTVKPGTIDVTGSYIVGINNVQDVAGNVIAPVSYLEDVALKENIAPTVTTAKLTSATTIRVNMSEVVDSSSANPFEVYVDGAKVGISAIAAVTGGTTAYADITLTIALTDLSKPITVKVKSDASIKDVNGNSHVAGGTYTVTSN